MLAYPLFSKLVEPGAASVPREVLEAWLDRSRALQVRDLPALQQVQCRRPGNKEKLAACLNPRPCPAACSLTVSLMQLASSLLCPAHRQAGKQKG